MNMTLQATTVAPAAPQGLEQTIEQTVREAVNQALRDVPPQASAAERSQIVREKVQEAIDRARAKIDAARENSTPVVGQPQLLPRDMIPPQAVDISLAFFFMIGTIVIGLPIARALGRRMDRRSQAATPEVTTRLDRIEQAIEAVAIEVERVSEGQRFTTKVMSEMRGLPSPAPAEAWPSNARHAEPVPAPASETRR
jgi:hypothetical protein